MASMPFPAFRSLASFGDCHVKEGVKIPIYMKVRQFLEDPEATELTFPASFTSDERKFVHLLARFAGLKSRSTGKFPQRSVSVTKKGDTRHLEADPVLKISSQSSSLLADFAKHCPLSDAERIELTPRDERGDRLPYTRDGFRAAGRLATAIPQIPRRNKVPKTVSDFRASLPIASYADKISDLLEKNQVVIIAGETGCGKTTQVPQIIIDDYLSKKKEVRILCTQPRRLSAISVAERVATEMGDVCGSSVGYMIRLESKTSPMTFLTFCTTGVLTRTMMSNGEHFLKSVTHVIVDEVHERDRNCDFLLTCLKQAMERNRATKFILMSATVNTNLSTYFKDCPIIRIPGRSHPVREVFLEEVLSMTNYSNPVMEDLRKRTKNTPCDALREWVSRTAKTKPSNAETSVTNGGFVGESSDDDPDFIIEPDSDDDTPSKDLSPEEWDKKVNALMEAAMETGDDIHFTELMNLVNGGVISPDHPHSSLGLRALMCAAYWDRVDELRELLAKGASVHPRTWGPTIDLQLSAADWARVRGYTDSVDLLAEASDGATNAWSDELTCTQKRQRNMNEEMKANLALYLQTVDDEFVDTKLLVELLLRIHRDEPEGAVLVFLPGYEQIMCIRDAIVGDQRFAECSSTLKLFVLHSSIQSADQAAIFKPVQRGTRKVILSTNIAETSITVPDVVYVIDSGKVKEKHYEVFTGACTLRPVWISRAASVQRAGRAGRCRAGTCYRLYSSARFEQMAEFQSPEILRTPLQELCLQAKALMIDCSSVADFLGKAPDPPSASLVRDAVNSLKALGAMDDWEDLTELGSYLLELPLDPRLSKMVLYALELKCLDPILTIVSCLAVKDPFKLPRDPEWKRLAFQGRQKLSEGAMSDHLVYLRAFQFWSKAKAEGRDREKRLVDRYFINLAAMEEVSAIRGELVGNLRACGLIRCRNAADIRALNVHSDEWPLVKFVLAAGLLPNLARVFTSDGSGRIEVAKEARAKMHPGSIVKPVDRKVTNAGWPMSNPWMVFEEMSRRIDAALLRNCTIISPATVVMLNGPMRMSGMIVQQIKIAANQRISISDADESDSETEKDQYDDHFLLALDNFVKFKIDREDALHIVHLRQKFNAHMLSFLKNSGVAYSADQEEVKPVVRVLVEFLREEERALGLPTPLNIGTKPKAALSDCYSVPSFEEVGGAKKNDEKTDGFNWDRQNGGDVRAGGSAYFIVKVNHHRMLQAARESKQWAFHHSTEKKLLKYIKWKERVFIFLNNLEQGIFHGCLYIVKNENSGQGIKAEVPRQEFCYSYLSSPYKIEWVCHAALAHDQSRQLRTPDGRRVDSLRDGQEISEPLALELMQLMRDNPASVPEYQQQHGLGQAQNRGQGYQRRGGGGGGGGGYRMPAPGGYYQPPYQQQQGLLRMPPVPRHPNMWYPNPYAQMGPYPQDNTRGGGHFGRY